MSLRSVMTSTFNSISGTSKGHDSTEQKGGEDEKNTLCWLLIKCVIRVQHERDRKAEHLNKQQWDQ